MITLLNILSLLILFQLGMMSLFLFTSRRGRALSNRLLAVFFMLLFLNIADGLLTFRGYYVDHPGLAQVEDGFVFLLGPVLWLYTQSLVYKRFTLSRRHWPHLIPFVVVTVSYQVFYHTQSEGYQKLIQDAVARQTLPTGFYLSVMLIYLHVFSYLVACFRLVRHYRQEIREQFSTVLRIDLAWLNFMLFSIAGILVVSSAYTFLPAIGLQHLFPGTFIATVIFLFVFSSVVIWKGLRQPELFSGLETESAASHEDKEKKTGITITAEDHHRILTQLEMVMREQKPYLNADLSLDQLATLVSTTPKRLSQCINGLGQNFFDYVNTFRIEEAKRIFMHETDPRLTILEVMYRCGFNSKSSFNTLFRLKTGQTPSTFRHQALSRKA
jgi:AraC-like DNA-binding protein